MTPRSRTVRVVSNSAARLVSVCCTAAALSALVWILVVVVHRGISAFDRAFFLELPVPPGIQGGGVANAILGTFLLTFLASMLAVPLGVLAGVHLAESASLHPRLTQGVRFTVNILMSVPSIIVGLCVWGTLVVLSGGFSGWAGGVALALIMVPVVTRTTEDMLRLVPDTLRESALAIGASRWRVTVLLFRAARSGLITGVLLAVARVCGETAPLLFTALNSPYWPSDFSGPTANLPVTIFHYAMSPYADWQARAWGASLVVTLAVLVVSVTARFIVRVKKGWS